MLGTAQFSGSYGLDANVQKLMLDRACVDVLSTSWDLGIDKIDTAVAYGKAHRVIGEYLTSNPHRKYQIITKVNLRDESEIAQAKHLLSKTNVYNGTILLHKQDQIFNANLVKKFTALIDEEPHINWGLSAYDHLHAEKAITTEGCASIQIPVSLLNQDFVHSEFIKDAKSKGLKIVARSIYTLGIIFKDQCFWNEYPPSVRDMISEIKEFAVTYNIPISAIALQFVIEKANVDEVVIGVNSSDHLKNNAGSTVHPKLAQLLAYCLEQGKKWDSNLFRPELWEN